MNIEEEFKKFWITSKGCKMSRVVRRKRAFEIWQAAIKSTSVNVIDVNEYYPENEEENKPEVNKYTMNIPEVFYSELELIANEESMTVNEVMRMLIKTGLCIYNINKMPNGEVFIKTEIDGPQRRLFMKRMV